ncbi:MAG: hypothetical protein LIP23_05315, partial [Planctomycetes bacterium]|nr:hypothetical protein [Planctomycetota bacterium]
VVDALNARGRYRVTIKDSLLPGQREYIDVENVCAVNLRDTDRVVEIIASADLAGTSVGAANLANACGLIAKAVVKRKAPLSIMLCENLHGAAAIAAGHLADTLPAGFPLAERVGLVEAAISKMVPSTPLAVRKEDPLAVWAEAYNTLYLDREGYIGEPPVVPGVAWRDRFAAYVDRKLLIHNFGHAAAAYNGALGGYEYIWQCMDDEHIFAETEGCMLETSAGLARRHADVFTFDENRAWSDDLLRRFHNQALADPVFRVGRDLKRKLAPADRCIGALRLLAETGVPCSHTVRAVAAAMLFTARDEQGDYYPGDEEVVKMAATQGPEQVLTAIGGLDSKQDAEIIDQVVEQYRRLSRQKR